MVKMLLIQLDRFGDNLFIVPLIKGIKQLYPDSYITVLVNEDVKDILMGYKEVDSVITADWLNMPAGMRGLDESEIIINGYSCLKNMIDKLKESEFDRVINLNFSKITTLITSLLNVPDSTGFTIGSNGERIIKGFWPNYMGCVVQTRKYNPFHIVDVYRNFEPGIPVEDMSGFQSGNMADEYASKLFREEGLGAGTPVIAFQPGASNRRRVWPKERFSELAGLLIKSGLKVIVLGTNSERDITQRIKVENPEVVDLTGKTTFSQLAAVLKRCDMLVSNDTGTAHLSSAVGTRVVGLYMCHGYPVETGPYGRGHITISPTIECYPCKWKENCTIDYKCRSLISTGDVYSVINHSLHPDKPLDCNTENIEVNISIFDEEGFISYVPLVKRPLKFNDILRLAYKRLWNELPENRAGITMPLSEILWLKETYDITYTDTYDEVMSTLRVIEFLAERGINKSEEILVQMFSSVGRDINTIQSMMEELDIIDSLITEKGTETEIISPLTTNFLMQKTNIQGENPVQIVRDSGEVYGALKLHSSRMSIIINEIMNAVFQRNGMVNA